MKSTKHILLALALAFATPLMAAESCACDSSCGKACAEGKTEACGCQHCDCKDCACDGKANPRP